MKLIVINGPNLNMLGIREISLYGNQSYNDLVKYINKISSEYNIDVEVVQSNEEGKIVDFIQKAYFSKMDGIILNAAAFTHYSYAIYDAIKAVNIKTIEVHLTDISNREDFRKKSVIKDACVTSFYGDGFESYHKAIKYFVEKS